MEGLESMTPLESEKKDLMARLGEIYYKKCKESGNVTAEEAEILEKIARLDQEMPGEDAEYQGSVCPGCGAPVEPDQVFCVNCGIRLVEDDAVTEMHLESDTPKPGNVCPHCGAPVNDDQDMHLESDTPKPGNVCPHCGAPVNDDQDFCIMCGTRLGQPGQQAGGGPAQPEAANVPKRCPGCGKILPPEMHFCTACGTRVD